MKLQIGVKVLLTNEQGEWLFLRRTQEMSHGGVQVWDIPGGRIEPNEALMTALAREVAEETSLTLIGEPKLLAAQDIFVEPKNLHVVRLTYLGQASGTVITSDEHDEYKWMGRDEILAANESVDPYLARVITTV